MKEEKSFYEQEKEVERQKVTEQKPAFFNKETLKRVSLIGLSVIVGIMISKGISKSTKQTEPVYETTMGYEYTYDEFDVVDPIEHIAYVAPSGYTLQGDKAVKRVTSFIQAKEKKDKEGNIYYELPEGYTLVYIDDMACGQKTTEEIIDAATVTTYEAPEGYILIGDKCYKIVREEKEIPIKSR